MWSENFKKEFSDSLIFGGDGGILSILCPTPKNATSPVTFLSPLKRKYVAPIDLFIVPNR